MNNFSNKLGSFGPWIVSDNDEAQRTSGQLPDLLMSVKNPKVEASSILSLLNNGHFLGDRCLVKGISRQPWMSKSYLGNGEYEFHSVPDHKNLKVTSEEAAQSLHALLEQEITDAIGSSTCVGILLTGGMDSRMIAGILDSLIKRQQLSGIQVEAFTWGRENSRDVEYAKKIAQRLGWNWTHLETQASDLMENLDICVEEGCEFSPIHLHAMPKVAKLKGVDCILAGSYGDSIGRGEYSGQKVRQLKGLHNGLRNRLSLMKEHVYQDAFEGCSADFDTYWQKFPRAEKYQQYELDYQLHYMRRMLNPCMAIIDREIPVHQMFTSPEVFGYMWSLDPDCRGNEVYQDLMKLFETKLSDIPWARTGKKYMAGSDEVPDSLFKRHHTYSDMINGDLYDEITKLVISDELESLNIFNMRSLKSIMSLNRLTSFEGSTYIEEKILWLAALAKFVRSSGMTSDFQVSKEKLSCIMKSTYEVSVFNGYQRLKKLL